VRSVAWDPAETPANAEVAATGPPRCVLRRDDDAGHDSTATGTACSSVATPPDGTISARRILLQIPPGPLGRAITVSRVETLVTAVRVVRTRMLDACGLARFFVGNPPRANRYDGRDHRAGANTSMVGLYSLYRLFRQDRPDTTAVGNTDVQAFKTDRGIDGTLRQYGRADESPSHTTAHRRCNHRSVITMVGERCRGTGQLQFGPDSTEVCPGPRAASVRRQVSRRAVARTIQTARSV